MNHPDHQRLEIDLAPGVQLVVSGGALKRLRSDLADAVPAESDTSTLGERDLMWEHHSGGDRSKGNPWVLPEAIEDARGLRRGLPAKGRAFFELLLSEPGRAFTSEEILEQLGEHFGSAHAIAGALNGFSRPCDRAGRPFPFYWWEGTGGGPTRYAMRPSVAKVFIAAGE